MDAAKNSTVEATLIEARTALRQTLAVAESFSEKIHGPRPSDPQCEADSPDCLLSVASDLRDLAYRVQKELSAHHAILGFERNCTQAGAPMRASLR